MDMQWLHYRVQWNGSKIGQEDVREEQVNELQRGAVLKQEPN